jgi:uncharacterized membrane protein YfcA
LLPFGWSLLAGFIMSMGAGGGGILAGIGHISLLGIADANMIKVVNQILEFASRVGLGSTVLPAEAPGLEPGAHIRHRRTHRGRCRLVVLEELSFEHDRVSAGVRIVGRIRRRACAVRRLGKRAQSHAGLRKAREASDRMSRNARAAGAKETQGNDGPRTERFGVWQSRVRFGGEHFDFNPINAALGGFVISFVGSTLGVGGGFLVTPFMASVLLFPMYLVVGTSLVALMIPLTISVLTYLALEVGVDWKLVAVEVPAVLIGSFLGRRSIAT